MRRDTGSRSVPLRGLSSEQGSPARFPLVPRLHKRVLTLPETAKHRWTARLPLTTEEWQVHIPTFPSTPPRDPSACGRNWDRILESFSFAPPVHRICEHTSGSFLGFH